jgi:hypothetical protein
MGGYGHSRIRDFVLGGATKGVLSEPLMPILLSHEWSRGTRGWGHPAQTTNRPSLRRSNGPVRAPAGSPRVLI